MFKTIITGNLTADAEVRVTPNQHHVCNFTVAVNHGTKEKPNTTFVECAVWGKRAEGSLPSFLTKGQKVLVEGEPACRAYLPTSGGDPRAAMSINVDEIELLGGAKKEDGDAGNGKSNRTPAPAPASENW